MRAEARAFWRRNMGDRCSVCGVPRIISRTHRWENGCITNRAGGNANFSIYEASFHNRLFEELEHKMGPTINRMVYIAGRIAAADIARNLFTKRPVVRRLMFGRPFYRRTQQDLLRFTRAIGMGRIDLLDHRKGKAGAVRVTGPFHLAHCTAVILGGLDVMYGFPVAFTARVEGESYVGELVPGKRDSLGAEDAYLRLTPESLVPAAVEDGFPFPVCPRCRVPGDLGKLFSFDLEEGVIRERTSGDRHIFYGHQSLNAILREFERELGPEVKDFFVQAERDSFAAKISRQGEGYLAWDEEELRRYLALRGMGYLSRLEERAEKTRVEVANAFIPPVVTGRLVALWESARGRKASFVQRPRGSTLILEIEPADSAPRTDSA